MHKEKVYNQPELEIVKYSAEDILNTSGDHGIKLPDDEWNDD